MKNILKLVAAVALGAPAITPSLHAAESRPNIVFVLSETATAVVRPVEAASDSARPV